LVKNKANGGTQAAYIKKKPMKNKRIVEEQAPANANQLASNGKTRSLKIEEAGDPYRYGIVPKVRVSGKWLEAAGFPPGERLTLTVISPGVIEMRVCGAPAPTKAFHIAAMRLDHAIAADQASRGE
jgi:hypothetical protein